MKIKMPMRDLMVVEKNTTEKVTAFGLVLPGNTLETNTFTGRVIVVGPGKVSPSTGEREEVDVKVGDDVIFHSGSGIKVSEHGEEPEQYLLREEDILAVITK